MWFSSWLNNRTTNRAARRRTQRRPVPACFRPRLEALEDRTLLSNYSAGSVTDLIADINAANNAGGANTITLTAPTTSPYVVTAVDNTTNGANGLPVISGGGKKTAGDNLTIVGNGDTIERSTASGTPAFRLFDVASTSSLLLENVTLQNGLAFGSGTAADGGAIYNQGKLTLSGATVQNNVAQGNNGADGVGTGKLRKGQSINGQAGGDAAGGGIWSSGSLRIESSSIIQGNRAFGGFGGNGASQFSPQPVGGNGGAGGNALGGGLYVAGGSVNVTNATLAGNRASGGNGGQAGFVGPTFVGATGAGGSALGGGFYVAAGSVTLSSDVLSSNFAVGGSAGFTSRISAVGSQGGNGLGGGLYVAGGTLTMTNDSVTGNEAGGGKNVTGNEAGGRKDGVGEGGGLYILPTASVCLDSATVDAILNNLASTSDPNIHGPYSLC